MKITRGEWPILAAVFLDLLGFGMVIADFQVRAERLAPTGVSPGVLIGLLLASTFVVQFFVSPRWGRESDRRGRKPVLLLCTALSAVAMLVYGVADHFAWLLVSRILAGLGSANVVIAQAWISDTSDGPSRTAALGRVSAAISTGLVLGPPIGGELARLGENQLIGFVAGGASLLGVLWLAFAMPSQPPTSQREPGRRPAFDLRLLREIPRLRPLVLIAAIAWFSLAMLEGTFARLILHLYGFHQEVFGRLFGYEALLGIVVSGRLLGWLVKRYEDRALLRWAYVSQGVGLALNPLGVVLASVMPPMGTLFAASTLFAVGTGIANPTVNALCSRLTPDERQGELFGLLQGARAVGFVLGPVLGGWIFDRHPSAPYLLAGAVCLFAASIAPQMSRGE